LGLLSCAEMALRTVSAHPGPSGGERVSLHKQGENRSNKRNPAAGLASEYNSRTSIGKDNNIYTPALKNKPEQRLQEKEPTRRSPSEMRSTFRSPRQNITVRRNKKPILTRVTVAELLEKRKKKKCKKRKVWPPASGATSARRAVS